MKKVYVSKKDSITTVIDKVLKAPKGDVILYIPRDTKFVSTKNGFTLLRREIRAAKREVTIESIDEKVLESASSAGFKSSNPFLGRRKKEVSDIVTVNKISDIDKPEILPDEKAKVKNEDEEKDLGHEKPKKIKVQKLKFSKYKSSIKNRIDKNRRRKESIIGVSRHKEKKKGSFKRFLKVFGVLAVFVGILVAMSTIFTRVTVAIDLNKTDWDFVGPLKVSSDIKQNAFTNSEVKIRGITFQEEKNLTESYPATGSEFIERKAKGIITVYNAYSSDPQILVKTTRFVSPEGKIYRTDQDVTVPGAKIEEGKIIPSSTDVSVTADKAGDEYNLEPVPRFRIPGFQGTPKYDAFYGESSSQMKGGFVGEKAVPTDEDIESARENIKASLEEAAKAQLFLNLPEEVKIFDDTYQFLVGDEVVDDTAGGEDKFSITMTGTAKIIGFQEDDLFETFEKRVESESETDFVLKEYEIKYGDIEIDENGNGFVAPIDFKSIWTMPFDTDAFKEKIVGADETELKTAIISTPGVKSGEVNFWPFWVKKAPEEISRIHIDVK